MRVIITALCILWSVTSFAQTKQETIAWIKEKLEKYGGEDSYYTGGSKFENVQVSPCKITFKRVYINSGEYVKYTFNPSVVKEWEVSSDQIKSDAKVISCNTDNGRMEQIDFFYIREGEKDLRERMIKALKHLATFCEEGKGEAF